MSELYKPYWDKTLDVRTAVGPPARPSKTEVKIFESLLFKIVKKKQAKVLVLGSTPELRDLALKYKCEVTSADISLEALIKLRSLMKQNWENEILVRDNWLHMPLKHSHYDIILGDLILENLYLHDWNKFLMKSREILNKNGYFILREPFLPPISEMRSKIYSVIEGCRNQREHPTALFIAFLYLTYNYSENSINARQARHLLKLYLKNNIRTAGMRRLTKNLLIWQRWGGKKWFILPQKMLEQKLSKYFIIKGRYFGRDHFFSKYFPIYLLKVKK